MGSQNYKNDQSLKSKDMSAKQEDDCAKKVLELDSEIKEFQKHGKPDEASDEYYKKRNALYSQRKYYKNKFLTNELLEDKKVLEEKNDALRAQNENLEALLAWANEQVKRHETSTGTLHTAFRSWPSASDSNQVRRLSDGYCAPESTMSIDRAFSPSSAHTESSQPNIGFEFVRERLMINGLTPPPPQAIDQAAAPAAAGQLVDLLRERLQQQQQEIPMNSVAGLNLQQLSPRSSFVMGLGGVPSVGTTSTSMAGSDSKDAMVLKALLLLNAMNSSGSQQPQPQSTLLDFSRIAQQIPQLSATHAAVANTSRGAIADLLLRREQLRVEQLLSTLLSATQSKSPTPTPRQQPESGMASMNHPTGALPQVDLNILTTLLSLAQQQTTLDRVNQSPSNFVTVDQSKRRRLSDNN